MDIQVGDSLHYKGETHEYIFKVRNVSDYRPPEMRYALLGCDAQGNDLGKDYLFVGDDWFEENAHKLTRIAN